MDDLAENRKPETGKQKTELNKDAAYRTEKTTIYLYAFLAIFLFAGISNSIQKCSHFGTNVMKITKIQQTELNCLKEILPIRFIT